MRAAQCLCEPAYPRVQGFACSRQRNNRRALAIESTPDWPQRKKLGFVDKG